MVDPKVLTYGSWVQAHQEMSIQVSGIGYQGKELQLGFPGQADLLVRSPEDIDYVRLTQPLMRKMGWHRDPLPIGVQYNERQGPGGWSVRFWMEDCQLIFTHWKAGDISFWKMGNPDSAIKIQYLHELQYLYRLQAGKELKVSL